MRGLLRLLLAFAPLGFTPLLVHLLAHGALEFGGGEKDLVLVLPWLLWSVVFAGASIVLWRRAWAPAPASLAAAAIGAAVVLLAGGVLAGFGLLGIRA